MHTHKHTHTQSEDGSREVCDFFYFFKSPKLKASDFKLLISFIFPRLKLMEVLKERDMFEPRSKAVKGILPCSSSSPYGKSFQGWNSVLVVKCNRRQSQCITFTSYELTWFLESKICVPVCNKFLFQKFLSPWTYLSVDCNDRFLELEPQRVTEIQLFPYPSINFAEYT